MIKTSTLSCLLGASALIAGLLVLGKPTCAFNTTSAAQVRAVVEEYAGAALARDCARLETVLHPSATKQEYVRFHPCPAYGLYSYERDATTNGPRFSQSEWDDVEPQPEVVEILASTEMTASASLSGIWGTEYLHLIRVRGCWQIVHVLGIDPGAEHGGSPQSDRHTPGS